MLLWGVLEIGYGEFIFFSLTLSFSLDVSLSRRAYTLSSRLIKKLALSFEHAIRVDKACICLFLWLWLATPNIYSCSSLLTLSKFVHDFEKVFNNKIDLSQNFVCSYSFRDFCCVRSFPLISCSFLSLFFLLREMRRNFV